MCRFQKELGYRRAELPLPIFQYQFRSVDRSAFAVDGLDAYSCLRASAPASAAVRQSR